MNPDFASSGFFRQAHWRLLDINGDDWTRGESDPFTPASGFLTQKKYDMVLRGIALAMNETQRAHQVASGWKIPGRILKMPASSLFNPVQLTPEEAEAYGSNIRPYYTLQIVFRGAPDKEPPCWVHDRA